MIHSVRFICVLDTHVIYPLLVRDLMFWFAYYNLFTSKWSKHIFDEWDNVMERKNIPQEERLKRINVANRAFPDAMVNNYDQLIKSLDLPDEKDRHVLAAAIKTNANIIVTENLKDFTKDYLASFGLSAKSGDDFFDLNPEKAVEAFRKLVMNRTNPDLNEFEILDRLRTLGLKDTANYLHAYL